MSTRNIESTEPDYGKIAFEAAYKDYFPFMKWDNQDQNVRQCHKMMAQAVITAYSAQHRVTADELQAIFNKVGCLYNKPEIMVKELNAHLASHSTPSPELEEQVLLGQAAKEAGWQRMRDKCEYKAPNWTMWVMCDSGPEDYFDRDYLYRRFVVKGSPKDVLAPTGESEPEGTDAGGQECLGDPAESDKASLRRFAVEVSKIVYPPNTDGHGCAPTSQLLSNMLTILRRPRQPAAAPFPELQAPSNEMMEQLIREEEAAAPVGKGETAQQAKQRLEKGPQTLNAKWLDPECWDGCRSLVYKHERDEAREQVKSLTQQRDEAVRQRDSFQGKLNKAEEERKALFQQKIHAEGQLARKDAEICRLKSAPASPWRDAKSDPPKESDGDRNGCVEWLWLYEMFVPHLETKSWDRAWSDDDLPSHWRHTNLPPLPTPAVEQDEFEKWLATLPGILHISPWEKEVRRATWNAALASRKEGQSHE